MISPLPAKLPFRLTLFSAWQNESSHKTYLRSCCSVAAKASQTNTLHPSTSTAAAHKASPQQRKPSSCSREKAEPFPLGAAGHLIACTRSPLIYHSATHALMLLPKEAEQMCPARSAATASGSYQHHEARRQGSELHLAEDEGTFLLCTTTAGPSSCSLQPPWCFCHLLSRLRQSLASISAVTAAPPPWSPKWDSHIDSPVVMGCKFGIWRQCLHTQLHSQISTWDTWSLLRSFGVFTSLVFATGACSMTYRKQNTHSGHGHAITIIASLQPCGKIKEIISLHGSELRQILLLPVNY